TSFVRSVEPVSTTMTSSTRSATEPRQAGRLSSSSRTIMVSDTPGRPAPPPPGETAAGTGPGAGPGPGAPPGRRGPVAPAGPPFPAERGKVLGELRCGAHPGGGEGAAAVMMHDHVQRHQQGEAGPPRPHGQVVVVEEAQPVALVEPAQVLQRLPPGQQAEAR